MKYTFIVTDSTPMWNEILKHVIESLERQIQTTTLYHHDILIRLFNKLDNIHANLGLSNTEKLCREANKKIVLRNKYNGNVVFSVTVVQQKPPITKTFRRMENHETLGPLCFKSLDNGVTFEDIGGRGGLKVGTFISNNMSFWILEQ